MRTASILSLVLSIALLAPARAADPNPPAPDLPRAYAMALQVTGRLQARADKLRDEGKPAGNTHRAFALRAGLNTLESDALDRVAARLRSQVEPLDQRAMTIIQAARAKFPGGRLSKGVIPPPPPAELGALQRQKDAALEQAVRDLEREMGALGYSKLGSYLIQSASEGAGGKVVRRPDDIGPMRQPVPPAAAKKEGQR